MSNTSTPIIPVFSGEFTSPGDVLAEFHVPDDQAEGVEVVFGDYVRDGYDGRAEVLFIKDGKLYTVYGSHCSCYGLEDQWEPVETSVLALRGFQMPSLQENGVKNEWDILLAQLATNGY